MSIHLTLVQSHNGPGKSTLQPVLARKAIAPPTTIQFCDHNSGTCQPIHIYDHLHYPAVI